MTAALLAAALTAPVGAQQALTTGAVSVSGAAVAPAPAPSPAPARAPLRLEADLSERTLVVRRGDEVLATYDVAVGKPGYPTPTGRFTIERLIWNPGWVPPDSRWARGKSAKAPGDPANPMKVVKLFFREPDYYIHGTGAVESLGSAASHGCLRMSPAEVAQLARLVMEHGGQPRDDSWFTTVLDDQETRTVRLAEPVEMVVRQ